MKTTATALVTGFLSLTFAVSAMAANTLQLPVMMAENTEAEVSTDAESAVKVEEKQETTTTAKAAAVGATQKKWTVGYLSENGVVPNLGQTFSSQNNINVSYAFDADHSLQIRQYFLYNITNQDNPYEWTVGDTALQYTDTSKKIAGADVLFYARAYLPTSYYAAQVGKYELRLYGAVTQAANKYLNITYYINPRFYSYSVSDNAQTGFQVLPGVTMTYASQSAFATPFLSLYTEDMWGNGGQGVGLYGNGAAGVVKARPVNQDYFFADVGTNLNISKKIGAMFYYEDGYDLRAGNTYQPIDNSNSSWNLIFWASM